jgi:hypothetical protein
MNLTVNQLIATLQQAVVDVPEYGEVLAAMAKDPEGNGFSLINSKFLSTGTIGEVCIGGEGRPEDFVGRKVLTLWPGYPQFEEAWEEEEDDD